MQNSPLAPTVHDLICAALRREAPAWPQGKGDALISKALHQVALHGVGALLHSRLHKSDWPAPMLQALRDKAVQQAMWELRHQQVLAGMLAVLEDIGVQPVLLKGTALAYSLYADPVLRTRGDTDLLIPIDAKARVHEALLSLGFERSLGVAGEYASYQANYTRQTAEGGAHVLDLHWKINNSEVLSRLFTYEELMRDAIPLPALGSHALGTCPVHSMLIACTHRATHRTHPYHVDGESIHNPDRLIWLADIHFIAGLFSSRDWEELLVAASEKGLRQVVLEGLQSAAASWHTAVPESVQQVLVESSVREAASTYLQSGRLGQQWLDFRALRSVTAKLQFLREIVFPSADYMQAKFGNTLAPLPLLYIRRVAGGIAKRLAGAKPH